MPEQKDEKYELLPLAEQQIETLHNWNKEEKHFEYYTCRPLKSRQSLEDYKHKTLSTISEGIQKIYVLSRKENPDAPLGKITLFDFNPRNHSAEFGYYLPDCNRGQGLGSIMLSKFIEICFTDAELDLNKIYATTSSINLPSIKLLEKSGFKLDGRMREHYWINENRYDQLIYSMLKGDGSSGGTVIQNI